MSWITQLPDFLSWKPDSGLSDEVETAYVSLLESLFLAWCGESVTSEREERQSIRERFTGIGPIARKRFLQTPDISALLLQRAGIDHSSTAEFFHACLLYIEQMPDQAILQPEEQLKKRQSVPSERQNVCAKVWNTAATDVPTIWEQRPSFTGAGAWGIDMQGCFLDVAGSFNRPQLADLDLYNDFEVVCLATRLAYAFDQVALVEGVACDLLRYTLQVIVLRKDSRNLTGFSSSSWPGIIGLMALTNAHRLDLDDAWIVDALIHEAIHAFLYSIECFEPFYSSKTQGLDCTIVSPWSGRMLKLHSYVHACFVWYGLWCFWSLAIEREVVIGSSAVFLRDRAHGGFLKGDVVARLDANCQQITQPISQAIATLQRIVIGS